jgi:hypothetical protein
MRADLWRRKLLFKAKRQLSKNNSDHRRDERHNTKVDERMHSEDAKIVDIVGKHLQIKEPK